MTTKYNELLRKVYEINDIEKANALLGWDRETNMPKAGISARVQQMTTLSRLSHTMFTSDEMGEFIEVVAAELDGAPYDSDEASLIRLLRRTYANARKLPLEFVARISEVGGHAHSAWTSAREENDFVAFQPWLEQVVELGQEMAEYYGYNSEMYDALLDKYEFDMKTAEVRETFAAVKRELIPLREAIEERGSEVDDSFLHQSFDIDHQKQFARFIAPKVGYDFSRGHLGTVVHPFATSFSRNDVRR